MDDGTRGEHALDDRMGVLGDHTLLDEGSFLERAPGDRLLLLERYRDPVEGTHVPTAGVATLGLARRGVRLLAQLLGERVDRALDSVGAGEHGIEQLDRGELAAGEPADGLGRRDPVQLCHEVDPIVAAHG